VAANLAVALAARPNTRVCLVDLDLAFGDIAITLQLFPARTIADAVLLQDALDFSVLEPLLTPHKLGFSTLVAPVQPDAKDSIPASLIARVLDTLKSNFDVVVVDTSPAFDEHVLQAFDETDELLLITTLDVPTLKNVKIACETLDLLNFPKPQRHLVLNRADDRVGLAPEKVESTLGMTIAQRIPTSAEVANATNVGEPIVASHPRHPVSQAIMHLADIVTGGPAEVKGKSRKTKSESPRRGLLRRQER
jgi:pilus assembly protein CpaE